jgi:signal transduction histidine kinase
MLMLEDITDRLALEAAYNTQIAVQQETLDNLREGTVLLGGDGRVRLWNPAFEQIWNLPDNRLQSHPHWRDMAGIMTPNFAPDEWQVSQESLIIAPLSHLAVEKSYPLRDGRVVEFAAQPLPDGAMLLRFLDVTDKAQLTAALQDRADALEAANRLKSEFLYNVSYQLRTPLNTITGFAEVLKLPSSGELNDRQADYVNHILDAAENLVTLIDNLLVLSSIQAGQVEITRAPVDIYRLLSEVKEFSVSISHAYQQQIVLEADADLGTAELDEARMKQVLLNLISNALRYSPPKTPVTLGARREARGSDAGILFWVRDEGSGVAEMDQERVFQPFERTNKKGAGVGLGLTLVKSLVELHNGNVNLISISGTGTEVQCWIPG